MARPAKQKKVVTITANDMIAAGVHLVFLNGVAVPNVREFQTGPQGYVIYLDDQQPKDVLGRFAEVKKRGGVAVAFHDGTFIE